MANFLIFATFLLVFIFIPCVILCSKLKPQTSPLPGSTPQDISQQSVTDVDLYNAPLDSPSESRSSRALPTTSRSSRSVKPKSRRLVLNQESSPARKSPKKTSPKNVSPSKSRSGLGSNSQRAKKVRKTKRDVPEKVELAPAPARDQEEDKKRAKFAFLWHFFKRDGDKQKKEAEKKAKDEETARIAAAMKTLDDEYPLVEPKTGILPPSSDDTQTSMATAQAPPPTSVSAISGSNREHGTKQARSA